MPGLLLSISYDPADLLNVLQQKLYNVGVLYAMRGLLLKDIIYVLCLHALAIRAILCQRCKDVGNGHNPRTEGHFMGLTPERIPFAVQPLVVISAPFGNHLKSSDGAEDGEGVVDMLFYHGHLRMRQPRWFFKDRVGDDQLAKIMEQSRYFHQLHLGFIVYEVYSVDMYFREKG